MPGLRHAHTLQQLKMFYEYSPPGEYLIKQTKSSTTNKKQTKRTKTTIHKRI